MRSFQKTIKSSQNPGRLRPSRFRRGACRHFAKEWHELTGGGNLFMAVASPIRNMEEFAARVSTDPQGLKEYYESAPLYVRGISNRKIIVKKGWEIVSIYKEKAS